MPLDIGRVTHLQDLMHRAESSNGTAITSNWVVSTDGSKAVTWRPESASALSYASNSNDVASANAPGASSLVSRADHVHRGVRTVTSNTSNSLFGDVNVAAGTGIAIAVSGQTVTLTNTGVPGPAGSGASYGSNSNDVSYADAPGASPLASRADHVHLGVTSLSHSSNTYTGPVTLETEGSLYIVRSAANTYRFGATSGGGSGGSTDAIKGQIGLGGAIIPGLQGSADIRVAGASDDEFDTTDTTDPMTGWTTVGTPTAHDINSTRKSHYYVKLNSAAGVSVVGIQKAKSPAFTVTTHLADWVLGEGSGRAQLMVGEATPGKMVTLGFGGGSATTIFKGEIYVDNWTNPTTYGSARTGPTVMWSARYFRIIVASSTDLTTQFSQDGVLWTTYGTASFNPAFTVGCAGLIVDRPASGLAAEAVFDWIRF